MAFIRFYERMSWVSLARSRGWFSQHGQTLGLCIRQLLLALRGHTSSLILVLHFGRRLARTQDISHSNEREDRRTGIGNSLREKWLGVRLQLRRRSAYSNDILELNRARSL
ncbi:hypothetical protein CONLIGDRAFT_250919 [Coniochaeta ligniaria NRRL 30616]|uniref:Uncharacterized protein n=1 Tax=Coniochaeta ligniaria NRRL 30616 TaxID=1408157 RepID=A0A1J7IWF7_9PEZI|nr:hypothetical protein CONLIGDRAFT_250919 [Coniochaeta ligniaria NRRL 30616]